MHKNFAYIGIGSNVGDKLNYLKKAITSIDKDKSCIVEKASSVYETLPYGNKNQENFFNAAIRISTDYGLPELLNFLKQIESQLGRIKTEKWGPREVDLDLLFYNSVIYSDERITVPHKEVIKRDFVLAPLCEIAPDFIHPELNKKICDICIDDSEKTVIRRISEHTLIKRA